MGQMDECLNVVNPISQERLIYSWKGDKQCAWTHNVKRPAEILKGGTFSRINSIKRVKKAVLSSGEELKQIRS